MADRQITDTSRNRCAWVADGDRCRYVGAFSYDTHGGDKFFCAQHSSGLDPVEAAQVVNKSFLDVGADFDYSSEAIVEATRRRYRENGRPRGFVTDLPRRTRPALLTVVANREPGSDDV